MIDHPAKVHMPKTLSKAVQYAAAVLTQFGSSKGYKVYCPDDLCSGLELSGLHLEDGNMPLNKAFAEVSLDMNISVIHSFAGHYADYSCREEAAWAAVRLLAECENADNKETVNALFAELSRSFGIYVDNMNEGFLQAAEPYFLNE